jgi:dipeptidyl aminopeptidase/acylaminoacyl peptidase
MGEVYRARDSRLGRDVAIKILSAELAGDPDALARFEREGRAVAALSHPNIVALYDVGREGNVAYAVTELLEGSTLRERLQAGSIPPSKALAYVRAVAEAAAAAHARGIVHRDLKPENVFLTDDGRIKVLDFGIAQLDAGLAADPTATATRAATGPGTMIGTIGYMAPEQVRGAGTDARTDVFALGALLYELLTGQAAFARDTPADTVSAILSADPGQLPRVGTAAGAGTEQVVRRCLEKNPLERFQSARDVAFALEAVGSGSGTSAAAADTAAAGTRRMPWAAALAAVAAIAAIAGAYVTGRSSAAPARQSPAVLFSLPASIEWFDAASVSPDGRMLAYTGGRPVDSDKSSGVLFLRPLASIEPRILSDTRVAVPPLFWSPDSRHLAYFVNATLMIREVPDGPPRAVGEIPERPTGASWGSSGVILAGTSAGLYRLPASGGPAQLLMRTDPTREVWRSLPSFLADGQRFIYTALTRSDNEVALETRVASLDGKELGTLTTGATGAMYADGHLFFGRNGALFAQAFDDRTLKLSGEPRLLAPSVSQNWRSGFLAAHASNSGVVVYRTAPQSDVQFTWFDRTGHRLGTVGAAGSYTNFDITADGRRIAATRRDPKTGVNSLVVIDAERGVTTPISPLDEDGYDDPTWAPDGRRIAFRHGNKLAVRVADGGDETTIVDAEAYPDHFTRDGRFLTYGRQRAGLYEAWALDTLTPGAKPISLVPSVTLSDEARFSKNEKWLAYSSNHSGTDQVWIIPFPPSREKWQISQNGGVQPRWSADGNELFYLNPDGYVMAVSVPDGDPRRAGQPRALFATGLAPSNALDQIAVVGDRFLLRIPADTRGELSSPLQVLVNWSAR